MKHKMNKKFYMTTVKEVGEPPAGTAPVFIDNGSIVYASGTEIDIPFPATVDENDTLVMQVIKWVIGAFTTPSGWVLIDEADYLGAAHIATYIRRADGDETGSQTVVTGGASDTMFGIMARYSGVVESGTMFEAFETPGFVDSSTIDIPEFTTLGDYRLAIALYFIAGELHPSDPSDYTEDYDEIETTGSGIVLVGNSQEIVSEGTVDADSSSMSGSLQHVVHVFALIPEEAG